MSAVQKSIWTYQIIGIVSAALFALLVLAGCGNDENSVTEYGQTEERDEVLRKEVEIYVNALNRGQYKDNVLPSFTCDEGSRFGLDCNLSAFTYIYIDELLKYRNDKSTITEFPWCGASSYWQDECALRVYVLWTIEYIRIKYIDGDLCEERFPSQNPILALQTLERLEWVLDYNDEAYQIASDAYYAWWANNKGKLLMETMKIDPLEETEYKWH
jgi:hypothetical protein